MYHLPIVSICNVDNASYMLINYVSLTGLRTILAQLISVMCRYSDYENPSAKLMSVLLPLEMMRGNYLGICILQRRLYILNKVLNVFLIKICMVHLFCLRLNYSRFHVKIIIPDLSVVW